jgi:hypothetical protein
MGSCHKTFCRFQLGDSIVELVGMETASKTPKKMKKMLPIANTWYQVKAWRSGVATKRNREYARHVQGGGARTQSLFTTKPSCSCTPPQALPCSCPSIVKQNSSSKTAVKQQQESSRRLESVLEALRAQALGGTGAAGSKSSKAAVKQ